MMPVLCVRVGVMPGLCLGDGSVMPKLCDGVGGCDAGVMWWCGVV